MANTRIAWGLVACMFVLVSASAASAQDDRVVGRLTRYGQVSSAQAGRLARGISKQMARSAGLANQPNDPLRLAVSKALFGSPTPPDKMSEASMRLRLYGGLNEWALEALFPPRPGVVMACQRDFGASRGDCEALVAAAGRVALSDARQLGGGDAPALQYAAVAPAPMAGGYGARPMAPAQPAPQAGRFKHFDSGFHGGAAAGGYGGAAPAAYGGGYGQPSRFGAGAPTAGYGGGGYGQPSRFGAGGYGQRPAGAYAAPASGYAAPASTFRAAAPAPSYGAQPSRFASARPQPTPVPVAAPVPAARPMPMANTNTKEEYQRRRQAYLEHQRQEMAARKAKTLAAVSGEMRPKSEAPAKAAPAAAPKAAASKPAAAAAAQAPAEPEAEPAAEAEPEPEPAPAAKKETLDEDFLDGLLADPLGKKK